MPLYAYGILTAGWLAWMARFLIVQRNREHAQKVDRRARWGILLEVIGYALLWQNHFWERPLPLWRLALSLLFFTLASVLSWTAVPALGRQWRIDAALSSDHQLVTTGPYGVVRHPIYTSMLCMLLGTGFMITPLRTLLVASLIFTVGTEIRVRVEDELLAARFGEQFLAYRRSVPAYVPFLR
jgi:protein-S-isoprenylcysteine O-methyltransferase Ste14